MIFRSFISIAIALLISLVLIINTEDLIENLQKKPIQTQIESEIFDLKVSGFEPHSNKNKSKKKYDLVGSEAISYSDGTTEIKNMNLKYYDNTENQFWHIQSDLARFYKNANQTYLLGNVIASNEEKKTTLTTDNLLINHNKKIIENDDWTTTKLSHQKITSKGIKIDYSHKIMNFKNEVENLIDSANE